MATYQELRARSQQVRDEQNIGGNTALRVGQLLMDIVKYFHDNDAAASEYLQQHFAMVNDGTHLLNWQQSPIVILHTMGETYDEGDFSSLSQGENYYRNGFIVEANGQGGGINGETPKANVLYVNLANDTLYTWNGSSFDAITSGGGGGSISGDDIIKNAYYSNGNLVLIIETEGGDKMVTIPVTFDASNYVPTSRTVNGKALNNNITLSQSDIPGLVAALAAKVSGIKTSDNTPLTPDSNGVVTLPPAGSTISPATASPSMDGTAAVGSSAKYAREDHVHPHDSTKANASDVYSKTDADTLLAGKQSKLTFDGEPTTGSNNPVKSGGVKTALDNLLANIRIGSNGNWFVGQTDTNIQAQGPAGNVNITDASQLVSILVNDLMTGGAGNILSAEMGKKLAVYLGIGQNDQIIDLSQITVSNGWLSPTAPANSGSVWVTDYQCKLIPVTGGSHIEITAKSENPCFYCFLISDTIVADQEASYATGYSHSVKINESESAEVTAPSNARYMYISHASTGDRSPQSVRILGSDSTLTLDERLQDFTRKGNSGYDFSIQDENGNIIIAVDEGHVKTKSFDSSNIEIDKPSTTYNKYEEPVTCIAVDNTRPHHLGQINAIRKALQQCNVKWTPIRDTIHALGITDPYIMRDGKKYYKPGEEYTGIPYSSPSFIGRAVGSDVSLETFMTAVKNPNSVLYTIDLGDYVNGTGPYYGNNCSSFTNVIQGIHCMCKGRNNNFGGNKILASPKNVEALQIGDVIYLSNPEVDSGHTIAIIGIERNQLGFMTKIIEAEQDGTCAKVYEYTPAQFEQRYFKGGYGLQYGWIYRNMDLVDNTEFEQQFVPVYDADSVEPYEYSEAVGINIGNRANFNKDDDMPIEVTLLDPSVVSSFTLYKGTTSLGTYSASNGTSGYGNTKIVTIDKANLDAGTYEVRPSTGVSQYFCLAVPGTITASYDEDSNLVVSSVGHSSNLSPYGVIFISNRPSQTTRGLWLMKGESSVVIPKQWIDFIDYTNDIAAIRVFYRNEFGTIFSERVEI